MRKTLPKQTGIAQQPASGKELPMIADIRHILYATDLSENSTHALQYAARIAERFGADLTVLHVIEDLGRPAQVQINAYLGEGEWERLEKDRNRFVLDQVSQRVDAFCAEIGDASGSCPFKPRDVMVRKGSAPEVILKEAEQIGADLIVMGTHGYGVFADALLGGTARRVVRRSRVPVMVVRPPEEE
jgi:nucleotide-binding universal stress UspA family protein